jgi:predicted dehydrogenase
MRIGILGSGFMGTTHARAFARLPDVEIVAVSSRSLDKAKKLSDEVGGQATTDDMEIVNDPSIDAVSITLPTHLHPQYTIAALRAGKHVLLEKPFALTESDCDTILEVHGASDRFLMLAHVLRFWPEYEVLVDIVQSGKLGKPLAAVATRLSVVPGWADWFSDPTLSGGAILDLMVHDFDALNWVLGTPSTIYARGHQKPNGSWDHVHALVDYGNAHGFAEGSEMMPKDFPFSCGLRVLCEGGSLEFRFQAGGVSVEMGGGSQLLVYEPGRAYQPEVPAGDAYQKQIAYFVECIRENRVPVRATPEAGRLAVKLANAARQSLQSDTVVPLT